MFSGYFAISLVTSTPPILYMLHFPQSLLCHPSAFSNVKQALLGRWKLSD